MKANRSLRIAQAKAVPFRLVVSIYKTLRQICFRVVNTVQFNRPKGRKRTEGIRPLDSLRKKWNISSHATLDLRRSFLVIQAYRIKTMDPEAFAAEAANAAKELGWSYETIKRWKKVDDEIMERGNQKLREIYKKRREAVSGFKYHGR